MSTETRAPRPSAAPPPAIADDVDQVWRDFRRRMPIAERFAYFDHAAVGPLFGPGGDAMRRFVDQATQLGDTVWPTWNRTLGRLRDEAATLLDCDPAEIATIANTTTGINIVAEGLDWRSGDNVVSPDGEFPSNLFPWQNQRHRDVELRIVPRRDGRVEIDDLIDACDSRTRLISVSWVGYATGYRIDLGQLVEKAHQRGVLVFVDAIQGMGVYPLSIRDVPVDFLAADGHKWMLGPEGLGVLMVRTPHIERLRCSNVGWASVRESHNYSKPVFDLRAAATRFESGSANMVAASALSESLAYFNAIAASHGRDAIMQRILHLADDLRDRLRRCGVVVEDVPPANRSGIVNFSVEGCTPAAVRQMGLDVDVVTSCRGGGVRAAVHAYNNDADLDRLVDVVADAVRSSESPRATNSGIVVNQLASDTVSDAARNGADE